MWNLKRNDTHEFTCKTETDSQSRERTFMVEGWGVGIVWEFGVDMSTRLYLKWITIKDPLQSTGKSAQCYVEADGRGVWERMDTCICMAEFLCYSPETVTSLLLDYTPVQN